MSDLAGCLTDSAGCFPVVLGVLALGALLATGKVKAQRGSYRGGLRWAWGPARPNATWPFIVLGMTAEGITVSPSRWALLPPFVLAWPLLPSWRFIWEELERVQLAEGAYGSPGVYFLPQKRKPFTFWTYKPEVLLRELERRGVAVEPGIHVVERRGT